MFVTLFLIGNITMPVACEVLGRHYFSLCGTPRYRCIGIWLPWTLITLELLTGRLQGYITLPSLQIPLKSATLHSRLNLVGTRALCSSGIWCCFSDWSLMFHNNAILIFQSPLFSLSSCMSLPKWCQNSLTPSWSLDCWKIALFTWLTPTQDNYKEVSH